MIPDRPAPPVPLIPSRGLAALYNVNGRGGRPRTLRRPVLAWSEGGEALVADMRQGRLVRAADDPCFVGLEPLGRKPAVGPKGGEE